MARVDFACPHCGGEMAFTIDLAGAQRMVQMTPKERADRWRSDAPQAVQDFLKDLEESGLFTSFEQACEGMPVNSRPNNRYKFFFTSLTRMGELDLPYPILKPLIDEFHGYIKVWGSNGMAAVTSNGRLRGFISMYDLNNLQPLGGPVKSANLTREWIKTRFGYVTSPIMFDEFRKRSIGAWDTMTGDDRG